MDSEIRVELEKNHSTRREAVCAWHATAARPSERSRLGLFHRTQKRLASTEAPEKRPAARSGLMMSGPSQPIPHEMTRAVGMTDGETPAPRKDRLTEGQQAASRGRSLVALKAITSAGLPQTDFARSF